jgi:hypothetical protein
MEERFMSFVNTKVGWNLRAIQAATVALALFSTFSGEVWAGGDVPTKFTNRNSIANTRHNLTQKPLEVGAGGVINEGIMGLQRNQYNEVCVYCHTPHGANNTIAAPLWNRTTKSNTYQTYDLLNTGSLTQPVSQPGASSLTCLTCHDGTTAIDAIVNMPGSGRYNPARITSDAPALLNQWPNPAPQHAGLTDTGCLTCHSSTSIPGATDFKAFAIGTDLRNDHPVGIRFPPTAGAGADFNDPQRKETKLAYFDTNANARPDSNEIRLYNSGESYEVECASCHDPHGVPSAGPGSVFNATFLRVGNASSAVCRTCHNK